MASSQTTFPSKQQASSSSSSFSSIFTYPVIPRKRVRWVCVWSWWLRNEWEMEVNEWEVRSKEIEIKRLGKERWEVKRTNKVIKVADPPDPTDWSWVPEMTTTLTLSLSHFYHSSISSSLPCSIYRIQLLSLSLSLSLTLTFSLHVDIKSHV